MTRFDLFDEDGCYFCGRDALPGRDLCADCARTYTDQDVAAKRLIASILRNNIKGDTQ